MLNYTRISTQKQENRGNFEWSIDLSPKLKIKLRDSGVLFKINNITAMAHDFDVVPSTENYEGLFGIFACDVCQILAEIKKYVKAYQVKAEDSDA